MWEPAWNKREISISISTRKRNFSIPCACAYLTLVLFSQVGTGVSEAQAQARWFIRHLEYFQISSNVTALAYALFSCAYFTCENVASSCLCLCLCLSHKWLGWNKFAWFVVIFVLSFARICTVSRLVAPLLLSCKNRLFRARNKLKAV